MSYLMAAFRSARRTAAWIAAAALLSVAGAGPVAAQDAAATEDEAPNLPVPRSAVTFPQIAICTDVQDREPVGAADRFSSDVGSLFCFTHVVGAAAPVQVFHRWYVGDRLVNEIPINVKGSSWRCWSRKTIQPGWSGACRVEIVSEEGDILATRSFTLGGVPARDAPEATPGDSAESDG